MAVRHTMSMIQIAPSAARPQTRSDKPIDLQRLGKMLAKEKCTQRNTMYVLDFRAWQRAEKEKLCVTRTSYSDDFIFSKSSRPPHNKCPCCFDCLGLFATQQFNTYILTCRTLEIDGNFYNYKCILAAHLIVALCRNLCLTQVSKAHSILLSIFSIMDTDLPE